MIEEPGEGKFEARKRRQVCRVSITLVQESQIVNRYPLGGKS